MVNFKCWEVKGRSQFEKRKEINVSLKKTIFDLIPGQEDLLPICPKDILLSVFWFIIYSCLLALIWARCYWHDRI